MERLEERLKKTHRSQDMERLEERLKKNPSQSRHGKTRGKTRKEKKTSQSRHGKTRGKTEKKPIAVKTWKDSRKDWKKTHRSQDMERLEERLKKNPLEERLEERLKKKHRSQDMERLEERLKKNPSQSRHGKTRGKTEKKPIAVKTWKDSRKD